MTLRSRIANAQDACLNAKKIEEKKRAQFSFEKKSRKSNGKQQLDSAVPCFPFTMQFVHNAHGQLHIHPIERLLHVAHLRGTGFFVKMNCEFILFFFSLLKLLPHELAARKKKELPNQFNCKRCKVRTQSTSANLHTKVE